MFSAGSRGESQLGIFLRSAHGAIRQNGDLGIRLRAGLIHFNELLLVLTMIRVDGGSEEFFDIWWDYHAPSGMDHFKQMSEQENLILHFCNDVGDVFSVDTENGYRSFFASLPVLFEKTKAWTEIEFDRAVRGFCAQSYPKENLWEMIQFRPNEAEKVEKTGTADDYPGYIPDELRPFYEYLPDQGHSIRIIPSMLESEAIETNPEEKLLPAPVKTVLRCGIRWVKGFPVAPIPFIPGHGLAVPPEDVEL
jgi:hypothetical protein